MAIEFQQLQEAQRQFLASLYVIRKEEAIQLALGRLVTFIVPREVAQWVKESLEEAGRTDHPRTFEGAAKRSLLRLLLHEGPQAIKKLGTLLSISHAVSPLVKWAHRHVWYTLTRGDISVVQLWWSMLTGVPFSLSHDCVTAATNETLRYDLAGLTETLLALNRRVESIVRSPQGESSLSYLLVAGDSGSVAVGLEVSNKSSQHFGYLEIRTWTDGIPHDALVFERPWVSLDFLKPGDVRWFRVATLRDNKLPARAVVHGLGLAMVQSDEVVFRLQQDCELGRLPGFPEGLKDHPLQNKLVAWQGR